MIRTPKPICRHPLENTVTVTLRREGRPQIKKNCVKKFIYVLGKDVDSKRKLEIKAKKNLEKGLFFGVTLIQAVEAKTF